MVVAPELLSGLNAKQLRELARDLIAQVASRDQAISERDLKIDERNVHINALDQQITSLDQAITSKDREILYRQTKIDQLTHEMAVLKRWKFGRSREQLDAAQVSLLEEPIDADIAAIEQELQDLAPPTTPAKEPRQAPKRAALPPELPRVELHHEPDSTTCGCQLRRIGEDVSEKLDYTPGVLTVQRHVRGKWACSKCQPLTQAPVPAQMIDKGLPTSGLLAQVLVAKYSDHLPLYRQGDHLWAFRLSNSPLHPGTVGGRVWRAVATAGRCAEDRHDPLCRAACRRDPGGHAQAGQQEDPPGLPLGCGGQVISDTSIGCCFADSRSKALGDKFPSLECSRLQL